MKLLLKLVENGSDLSSVRLNGGVMITPYIFLESIERNCDDLVVEKITEGIRNSITTGKVRELLCIQ